MEVNARGSSDQIFKIAVISEYVSISLRSVQLHQRLGVEKKKAKTAVKYKPFGIAMPCVLMIDIEDRLHCRVTKT